MGFNIADSQICKIMVNNSEVCKVMIDGLQYWGCPIPPTVGDMERDYSGGAYQFEVGDFTKDFVDPNGDSYKMVTIVTVPTLGTVKYNGVAVTDGYVFDIANIANLTYELPAGYTVQAQGYCDDQGQCYGKESIDLTFKTSDDSADQLYSNTATFALKLVDEPNTAPTVQDSTAVLNSNTFTFSPTLFTNGYVDPEGNPATKVNIEGVPVYGTLEYLGRVLTTDDDFPVENAGALKLVLDDSFAIYGGIVYKFGSPVQSIIDYYEVEGYVLESTTGGVLTFKPMQGTGNIYVRGQQIDFSMFEVRFNVEDSKEAESNEAKVSFSATGDSNIPDPYVNQPPTIGDAGITVDENVTTVITLEMLTSAATPPYNDPENDLVDAVRIDYIDPANSGTYYVNGVELAVGMVITREQLNAQEFTHVGVDLETVKTDLIQFSVRDEGSQTWVS